MATAASTNKKMISAEVSQTSDRVVAARQRMVAAGYLGAATAQLDLVHCNDQPGCETFAWIENGFVQCYTEVDGRQARVMDYAPGQTLQPHFHDIDELFEIRGGAVRISIWPAAGAGRIGSDVHSESEWLRVGQFLEVPANTPHCLLCDPEHGLQFHELVGEGDQVPRTNHVVAFRVALRVCCTSCTLL